MTPDPTPSLLPYIHHPGAPPTQPGPLGTQGREKAAWPLIIGVIAIVMGGLGLLGGVWSAASPFMMDGFSSFAPPGGGPNPFAAMADWKWDIFAASLALMPIAGLLIAGGIGLCMRRIWSVRCIRGWAVLKILAGSVLSLITALMQQAQVQGFMATSAAATPGTAAPGATPGTAPIPATVTMPWLGDVMFWSTLILSALWYAALPVFMLIWFALPFVGREVRSWRAGFDAALERPA